MEESSAETQPAQLADAAYLETDETLLIGDRFDDTFRDARAKKWLEGDFNVKLQMEKEHQIALGRPFIIWRKVENAPTPQNPNSKATIVPFVQHLDHSNSTMQHVMRYYGKGMRIAYHHIPKGSEEDERTKLSEIRQFCTRRDQEVAAIRKEILAELGMDKKIADQKKLQAGKNGAAK